MKSFFSKVVGVSHDNRQSLIMNTIQPGDYLHIFRQPDNPFDSNAIAVGKTEDESKIIGYLDRRLASDLAPRLDSGQHIRILVKEVTGQEESVKYLGVNIKVTVFSPEESEEIDQRIQQNIVPVYPEDVSSTKYRGKAVKRNYSLCLILSVAILLILIILYALLNYLISAR